MSFAFAFALVACGDDSGGGKDAGNDAGYVAPITKKDAGGDSGAAAPGMPFSCSSGATMCTVPEFMLPPGVMIPDAIAMVLGGGSSICALANVCSTGCCTDDEKCGLMNTALTGPNCIEQNQAGSPSTQCPTVGLTFNNPTAATLNMGMAIPVPVPGCCRDDGQCGLDLQYLGLGCVERSASMPGTDIMPGDGGTAMLESIPCTPGAGGDDGGSNDGG